jgi:hypothetical protein
MRVGWRRGVIASFCCDDEVETGAYSRVVADVGMQDAFDCVGEVVA